MPGQTTTLPPIIPPIEFVGNVKCSVPQSRNVGILGLHAAPTDVTLRQATLSSAQLCSDRRYDTLSL